MAIRGSSARAAGHSSPWLCRLLNIHLGGVWEGNSTDLVNSFTSSSCERVGVAGRSQAGKWVEGVPKTGRALAQAQLEGWEAPAAARGMGPGVRGQG